MSLRSKVDEDKSGWVSQFAKIYPWKGREQQPISYHVCISHRKRMRINKWQNDLEKEHHNHKMLIRSYGFIKGCSSQPQDMWVWPGLQLIGGGRTSRKVLNGVMYIVRDFNDETLRVRAHPDFGGDEIIELTLREAADNLRLCYAAVYQSCQGRTLKEQHVMLMDTGHRHFSVRHLYVGASRVTSSEYLHIAGPAVEDWVEENLPIVPLDERKEPDCADVQTAEEGMDEFARDRLEGNLTMLLEDEIQSVWAV